jgi:mannosylglycerate hydrolase
MIQLVQLEAHLDMYNRFLKADQIANELINYTNKNIFAKVKLNDSFGDPFIIYNTSAENIKFKSEVTIYSKEKNFKILNSNGEEIKFDLLDQSLVNMNFENIDYCVGEAGDSYDYSPPEFDKKYTTLNEQPKIKVLKNTEHFCEVLVSYDWMLPSSLIDEDTKRSEELVQNKIIVKYTFFDDQDWFDHLAGQQFGTIERDNEQTNDLNWTKTSRSKKISQFPFQEFVSNFDNKSGLGIITLDSSEYKFEANKDIKIILFRSFGYMGKANLINRPGRPSGIYWKTPDSYMVKTNKYKLSVVPFAGRENFQELAEAKNGILNPLRKFEVVRDVFFKKEDDLSVNGRNSLFKIEQQNITVSCLKKCENENAYILRVYNSTLDCIKNLSIKLSADISKAYYSNIAEDTCEEIKINKNEIIVDQINPNKIVSIKFII